MDNEDEEKEFDPTDIDDEFLSESEEGLLGEEGYDEFEEEKDGDGDDEEEGEETDEDNSMY